MGFSLQFYTLKNGEPIDGNRQNFYTFLQENGLKISQKGLLEDKNVNYLIFDSYFADLYITESPELSASLDHDMLSDKKCQFIYSICLATNWIIINPQREPMFIVPNNNHRLIDIP